MARDVHLSGYQARDYEVVDYAMYEDEASGLFFRGPPQPRPENGYISCVGAAQTLGCFCPSPYPALLQERLGLPVVNFGYGGASASFFLTSDEVIDTLNRGRLVVLQMMSGRSESNGIFESGGLEFLTRRDTGEKVAAQKAYRDLLAKHELPAPLNKPVRMFFGPSEVREALAQTRANWIESHKALIARIKVPVVLMWFSRRRPEQRTRRKFEAWWQRYDSATAMFGDYPQLVTRKMVEAVRGDVQHYVEAVTSRGSPQPLRSRFTGEPVLIDRKNDRPDLSGTFTHNAYYPSPEMHEDAAAALEPVCRALLGRARLMSDPAFRTRPILVTGCPRSGTTWVGEVIGASHDVIYVYEPFNDGAHHNLKPPVRFAALTDDTAAPLRADLDRLMSLGSFARRGAQSLLGVSQYGARDPKIAGRIAAAHLARKPAHFLKGRRVCIKDPLAFYAADWLHETYDANVVVMVRHPAGVVSSYLKLGWRSEIDAIIDHPVSERRPQLRRAVEAFKARPGDEVDALLLQWKLFTTATLDMVERRPDWTFVIHDVLCAAPQETFAALFDRIGLDYTPAIAAQVDAQSNSGNAVDSAEHKQHDHSRSSRDLVDAWRNRLGPEVAERVLGETGELWAEVNAVVKPLRSSTADPSGAVAADSTNANSIAR